MAITPLIPEIQALSPTSKLESQLQRPASGFTLGQLVQASVGSKDASTNVLTLHIGEKHIPVETIANFKPGQNLTLEVTALTPQLQLKVADQNQINELNQRIASSLHTILRQGESLSELANLTQHTQLPQLSTDSQQVLQQLQIHLLSDKPTPSGLASIITQIASLLSEAEATSTSSQNQTIGALLGAIQALPEAPLVTRQEAAALAKIFIPTGADNGSPGMQGNLESSILFSKQGAASLAQNDAMRQLLSLPEALQTALRPLVELYTSGKNFSQPLVQLTFFLLQAAQTHTHHAPPPVTGQQLQQSLELLGTNMERLLSQGKSQEAAHTLKFALLELTSQSPAPSLQQTVDEALHTIQFSQLVQMRLGFESIFFMPLPFPFLQSGFLLIDHKNQKDRQENQQKNRQQHELSLYLQLEGLGNLNITVHQEDNKINLTFYSQDASRAQFIGYHKQELTTLLSTGTLYSAQFLVGAQEPIKILIEKMLHAPTGMVNISV
nr:hypothetical protein [uncultured Desulfobulbus sp.]